jgi:hypothetical protein
MTLDLNPLAQLQPLFKCLSAGYHLNRYQDPELWLALEQQQDGYQTLFAALGFSLVLDGRGFAYFKTEQASAYKGKLTRRLALVLMLLFEYQADQGVQLFQFQQWRLAPAFLDKLHQHYQAILAAEDMGSTQSLLEVLDSAARIGFLGLDDGVYYLLPAVHRYLDLFLELADAERSESINIAADSGEDA